MGGSSKSQVVGYQYYEDQHIVLALSNFDFISRISFANKRAWTGYARGALDDWGEVNISKPGLFGGEKREGGVAGKVHIGMGWPDQPRLSRMVSRLGNNLTPAYRGVVSLYFDNFYFGNNPYIKSLKVRAQAIHKTSDGSEQWYDEKAAILAGYDNGVGPAAIQFSLDASGSMFPPFTDRYETLKEAMGLVLDSIRSSGIAHDIRVSVWGGTVRSITRYGVVAADLDDIRSFIDGVTEKEGDGTDFNTAVDGVNAFYESSNIPIRKFIFIADGQPNPEASAAEASATLFSTAEVEAFAFNIDYSGTEYSELMDNTPDDGVPVVDGGNASQIRDALLAALVRPVWDINPIHFIRECHTDPIWGGRYPSSKMGASYAVAADTLFEEELGVSFLFTEEIKWREIIEEIARHIDAIPYQDPDTGLMEIKLIRDDYDFESLPILDPSNSELVQMNDPNDLEVFNQVVIEFWNFQTGVDDTVTLGDASAIDMLGYVNSKTYSYNGLSNKRNATKVGERDLAQASRPFHQGRVKTNRSVANLKPGDVFRLTSPDDGVENMVCRVTKRSDSGLLNGDITLEFGEDIFGQAYTTFGEPADSDWVDPISPPTNFAYQTPFEVPYYLIVQDLGETDTPSLSDDACFFGFAGAMGGGGVHLDYDLFVYPEGTTQEPDPEFANTAPFTPYAIVASDITDPSEVSIPVTELSGMDSVRLGHIILVGGETDDQREVLALDAEAVDGDILLTVRRGLIDTVPKPIPAGTVLYFIETFFGGSETEYLTGESVEGYGVPANGQGSFLGPYTYHELPMAGRFFKPYPPANLKVEGAYAPYGHTLAGETSATLTWNYRDRVTQSDQTIDWFDSSDYGPESGTTFRVEVDAVDSGGEIITSNYISTNVGLTNSYEIDITSSVPPVGSAYLDARVWAIRSGEDSLQAAEARVILLVPPSGVSATYLGPSAPSDLAVEEI